MKHVMGKALLLAALMTGTVYAGQMDEAWLEKAMDHYESQIPDDLQELEVFCFYEYSDTYRGHFEWCIDEDWLDVDYYPDNEYNDEFTMSVDLEENTVDLRIELTYEDDTSFLLVADEVEIETLSDIFKNLDAIDEEYIYQDDALEAHDVKNDILIMYARFAELGDRSMQNIPDTNGLADSGLIIDLPEELMVDPAQLLSEEMPFVVNEHHFENGKCTDEDCDMTWNRYACEALAALDPEEDDSHMITGMGSKYQFDISDWIHFIDYDNRFHAFDRNQFRTNDRDGYTSQTLSLNFSDDGDINVQIEYQDYYMIPQEGEEEIWIACGTMMELSAAPEEIVDVLASKDELMERGTYGVVFFRYGDEDYEYFEDKTEQEAEEYMNGLGYPVFTKEEVCERLSQESRTFLLSLDQSMVEFGTSFTEAGIAIDKIK